MTLSKITWCLKQLLPLLYRSRYMDQHGNVHFVAWRMWLGRQFAIDDVVVDCQATGGEWPARQKELLAIRSGASLCVA